MTPARQMAMPPPPTRFLYARKEQAKAHTGNRSAGDPCSHGRSRAKARHHVDRSSPNGAHVTPYAAVLPQTSRGDHRLATDGKRQWTTYGVPVGEGESGSVRDFVLSEGGAEVRRHLAKRLHDRKPVAYDRRLLDDCRPAVSKQIGLSREGSSCSLCRRTILSVISTAHPR